MSWEDENTLGFSVRKTWLCFGQGRRCQPSSFLRVVNAAHAVLVMRGKGDHFYHSDNFVPSACEGEVLVEWGVGRPVFASTAFAVGGTLSVEFVEKVWGPAVVGTLLVAAAG